jgi:nitrogen regulatory protein P-II 1
MKKIEAIIKEERLDAVKKCLEDKGFIGMTVTSVLGRGQQKGLVLEWRAGEYRVDLLPKTKLEIVVADKDAKLAVDLITEAARTGEIGDGMIFVSPVEMACRVRTGECDETVVARKTAQTAGSAS